MKKIISFLILIGILVTVLFTPSTTLAADLSYLSDKSAIEFLQFLNGSSTYQPSKTNKFYMLLTGELQNSDDEYWVKQEFILFVYEFVDNDLYNQRLSKIRQYLDDEYIPDTFGEFIRDTVKDSGYSFVGIDFIFDTIDNCEVTLSSMATALNIRKNAISKYFKATIGFDKSGAYADILLDAAALEAGITNTERKFADEWTNFMYNLEQELLHSINEPVQPTQTYNICFNSNCADVPNYEYVYSVKQNNWSEPNMQRNGYIFNGWYWDTECRNSAAGTITINRDIVLYAKWIDRYHTIRFDYNCCYLNDYVYAYDILTNNWSEPETPTRSGYIFEGWYWDSACTDKADESFTLNKDLTFYAKWTQQYKYSVSNGKASITDFSYYVVINDQTIKDIEIPASIDGYLVTSIGTEAFKNSDILSVKIPNSVISIGEYAFANCDNLTSITIPDSVKIIGDSAFSGCHSLTNIIIPNSVTTIEKYAFSNCDNLTNILIGDATTSIDTHAFDDCDSLRNIEISQNNKSYSSKDGILFNKDKTILLRYTNGKNDTEYIIPDSVTTISDNAFSSCHSLTSITIPESVKNIGIGAFAECYNLKSLTIGNGVITIGAYAFSDCDSLTNITMPNSVMTIGDSAFWSCDNLTSITLPNSLTSIGNGMFCYCINLISIIIPNGVTTISDRAFNTCHSLTNILIPDSVTKIDARAFYGCNSLKTVYFFGTENQWNSISIDYDKELLTNHLVFVEFTKTTISEGGKTFIVNPVNIEDGDTVIIALYKDCSLVEIQEKLYESEELKFETSENYDVVKIMVWKSLNSLKPVTEPETIDIIPNFV